MTVAQLVSPFAFWRLRPGPERDRMRILFYGSIDPAKWMPVTKPTNRGVVPVRCGTDRGYQSAGEVLFTYGPNGEFSKGRAYVLAGQQTDKERKGQQ